MTKPTEFMPKCVTWGKNVFWRKSNLIAAFDIVASHTKFLKIFRR